MRKSLAVTTTPLALVIAFAFSLSSSSVHAMPAPTPGNVELSVGVTQWGAETETPEATPVPDGTEGALETPRQRPAGKSKAAMCQTLATAARTHDLPVGFFVRLINQESGFNPEVVSHAGAQGVAQFMPKVAEEWGLKNPFDPHAALVASARFLRSLYEQFGNWGLAAAAYNGGMGRVQKWMNKGGKLPDETRHYVMTITGVPAEKWVAGKSQDANFSIPPRAPCQEIAHLADAPKDDAKPSRTRQVKYVVAAAAPTQSGPSPRAAVVAPVKQTKMVAVVTVKRGTQIAKINTKAEPSKVATAKGKIAAPASIVADAAASSKSKRKTTDTVKVAEKSAPKSEAKATARADAKTTAKGKDQKKTPSKGVQVADARGARK